MVGSEREKVLVFGGLGDLATSVVGLYSGLFGILSRDYDIVAIDPACENNRHTYDFSYLARYASMSNYLAEYGTSSVKAVFVLTPVGTHLHLIETVSESLSVEGVLFVVEKPSFSLDEVSAGFNIVIPRLKERGASFYFIDTALVTPSMEAFFQQDKLMSLGFPNKIVAVATDNPIVLPPDLAEFEFQHRISALNRRQLLIPAVSGGAGFGFDMGIHAVAGLVRYLQKSMRLDAPITLLEVAAERLSQPELVYDQGAETHLYVNARLQLGDQYTELVVEAGKAGDIWDRRLELYYSDKVIALGFGTLKYPPYVWVSDASPELQTFDVSGSGYKMHFNDILSAMGMGQAQVISCGESESLMARSMGILSDIFDSLGTTPGCREKNIAKTEKHSPRFLSKREREIRVELQNLLNDVY